MTKNTGTILSDIYDAWRARDLDWLASYLPDDFQHVMHIPPDIYPMAGSCRGKTQVLERWSQVIPTFEVLRYETGTLLYDAHCAAAHISVRYRHRETGILFEGTKANFWTFEAAWPVRLVEYYDVAHLKAATDRIAARRGA
jgi:ketosteroid isomerase-like protein